MGRLSTFSRPFFRLYSPTCSIRRRRAAGAVPAACESLEERIVLSGISLVNGLLSVAGTDSADTVQLWYSHYGTVIQARLTTAGVATQTAFWASQVNYVGINSYGGNDTIVNDLVIHDAINAGWGADHVYAGFTKSTV